MYKSKMCWGLNKTNTEYKEFPFFLTNQFLVYFQSLEITGYIFFEYMLYFFVKPKLMNEVMKTKVGSLFFYFI